MAIVSVWTCWGADALHVGAICVDKNQCKERKKKTYLVGCKCMDVLACRDRLDMDDCEDKRKEKEKKNLLDSLNMDGSGCRCWWNTDG